MRKASLLLVEDEPAIRLAVRDALAASGHDVEVAQDGRTALAMALGRAYDLILLDLMLPGMGGVEVCTRLREAGKRTPLLMLTARGAEQDRVVGLGAGADDYVTKPFSVRELLARVEALLRRAAWAKPGEGLRLSHGGVTADLARLLAWGAAGPEGVREELTAREGDILRHLAGLEGRVASKRDLLLAVWGYPDVPVETRTVENTIGVLRRKLERLAAVGAAGGGAGAESGAGAGPGVGGAGAAAAGAAAGGAAGGAAAPAEAAGFVVTVRGLGFKLAPEVEVLRCAS